MSKRILVLCSIVCCCFVFPTSAEPSKTAGVFVYSSMCAGPEDDEGVEIVLMRRAVGDVAIYTRTEGAVMAPLMAYGPNLKIDDRSGHIYMRFVDPDLRADGVYVLEGQESKQAMTLTLNAGGMLVLPRIVAPESALHTCRASR